MWHQIWVALLQLCDLLRMPELVTLFLVPQDFAMLRGGSSLAFWQVGIHHQLVVMLTEFISSFGEKGVNNMFLHVHGG